MADITDFDEANAKVLAEILVDPATGERIRMQIIGKLLEEDGSDSFFEAMFAEDISRANCPMCDHENFWLIPEDELNQMGWVTSDLDSRVPANTTSKDCKEFQEACKKKKTTF